MIGTTILFIIGILLFIEGIILFLFPQKIKTLLNSFFKHKHLLQIIAVLEIIVGTLIILVLIL
ncbi:MAG: DUF2065 family protein [Nanoarchaeota archaeon]|nr:DUF2065 family protein [Nanoarchaeota archaeon]